MEANDIWAGLELNCRGTRGTLYLLTSSKMRSIVEASVAGGFGGRMRAVRQQTHVLKVDRKEGNIYLVYRSANGRWLIKALTEQGISETLSMLRCVVYQGRAFHPDSKEGKVLCAAAQGSDPVGVMAVLYL